MITASGVAARYPGAPEAALRDVTFTVGAGQVCAVLGPNGGGKSTLFRAITGELPVEAGTLDRPARTGVVPQTTRSRLDFPVSAHDVALMGAASRLRWWGRPSRLDRAAASDALARVGLAGHADRTFGALSGGQRQRVLIARALVQDAPLLLLDEPFAGLDAESAEGLMALVAALAGEGRALLVATHDVEQAAAWDLVLALNRRQVAFGTPGEVLDRATVAEAGAHHHCE